MASTTPEVLRPGVTYYAPRGLIDPAEVAHGSSDGGLVAKPEKGVDGNRNVARDPGGTRVVLIPWSLVTDGGVGKSAVTLYGILASKGPDVHLSHADLAPLLGKSLRSVQAPIRQLVESGWITSERFKDGTSYTVHDEPVEVDSTVKVAPGRRRDLRARARSASLGFGVYRLYAADGSLTYVGQTSDLRQRMDAHFSRWNDDDLADFTWEPHPTRIAALAAEDLAIRTEAPLHNKAGRPT